MEQEKIQKIDDTIDLEEIRELLGDDVEELSPEMLGMTEEEPERTEPAEEENVETASVEEEGDTSAPDQISSESDMEQTEQTSAEVSAAEQQEKKKNTNVFYEIYSMLHDVVYLLGAVTLVFVFAFRLVGVQGDSMLPTLHNRDYLILQSNFLYGGDDLQYGDVVVVNTPHYDGSGEGPIVKRIIATEGQTVDINFDTGTVYVDGVMLVEDYVNAPTYNNWEGELGLSYPAVVPENCIFVLGDNRNNSMDSRYAPIGMIEEQYVLGKVLMITLPGQTTDGAGTVTDPRDWGRLGLVS